MLIKVNTNLLESFRLDSIKLTASTSVISQDSKSLMCPSMYSIQCRQCASQ